MLVFFALAVVVTVLLAVLSYFAFSLLGSIRGRGIVVVFLFACACAFAALVVVWSMLPRIDRFEPPGPELRDSDTPELLAEIRRIAAATSQAAPEHVYLVGDVNAFVTQRGGIMGFGSRRVMGIGLPLLEILSVGEMRAVIAHEFGHFHGGDTKLGPWIYKTRGSIGRTVVNLARAEEKAAEYTAIVAWVMKAVRAPFHWFGTSFMRITQAISRAQELGADALAARVVGSAALADGLKKTHAGALAFDAYFENEVVPILQSGHRPPITEGYRRFVSGEKTAAALADAVDEEMREGEGDPFDSHPPLRERVAAVEALAMPPRLADDRRAIVLVPDVAALEARLAAEIFVEGASMTAIGWDESAARVFVPGWHERMEQERAVLAGWTPATIGRGPDTLRALCSRSTEADLSEVSDEMILAWATSLFGVALSTALVEHGWVPHNVPGAPIALERDGTRCEPFLEVGAFLKGETDEATWAARVHELGIAGADFGVAPAPRAPV
jgi:heat shock protein HtpX